MTLGDLSPSTAQNYISAINSVMSIATSGKWASVSPTKDCSINQRSAIRSEPPGALSREGYSRALDAIRSTLGDRAAAVASLAREFGLRSKEASLLDAKRALQEAHAKGHISVVGGTKGGRPRIFPVTTEKQRQTLEISAQAQGSARAVMPPGENWRSWREGGLRDAREIIKEHTGGGLHDLRAAYACERYKALTGADAPVVTGKAPSDRAADSAARQIIAAELGHGRVDVVGEYVGGRK